MKAMTASVDKALSFMASLQERKTPLHHAVGYYEIARMLIEYGVDCSIKDVVSIIYLFYSFD